MFNLQGSEIIFILLIALVVLGPEKLPGAIKRAMRTYHELRKMGDGFQSEFRSVVDEPLRELRETTGMIKDQADPKKVAEEAERAAHKAARKDAKSKEVVAEMHAAGERAQVADALADADAEQASRHDIETPNRHPSVNGSVESADETARIDEWADPVDHASTSAPGLASPAGAPAESLAPPPPSGPVPTPSGLPPDPTSDDTSDDDESAA